MKHELEFQSKSRKKSAAKKNNSEAQIGAVNAQPEPGKPWREPAMRIGECHKLPEREFRERLRRLQENPLFQKLQRLGVIRGRYRGDDFSASERKLTEKEIGDVINHKVEEITRLQDRYNVSDDDYKKFFHDKSGEDFDLDETAKQFSMSREDAYRFFRLSQEVKKYHSEEPADDNDLDWDRGRQDYSLLDNRGRPMEGNLDTRNSWGEHGGRDIDEIDPPNMETRDPEIDLPIAEIIKSGKIKCQPAGPMKKWIFNMKGSRERLKEVADLDLVSDEECKEAADIFDETRLLNEVRTQQYKVLEVIARDSRAYLGSGRPEDIKIQKQKDIAEELSMDKTRVSRIANKSVDTPRGIRPLSIFMANKNFVVKYILKEIENESKDKISNPEMAKLIEKRLQDSPENSDVKVNRQFVNSLRPEEESEDRKGDTYREKFYKSRKIKKYVENTSEERRRSLRKPGTVEPSGKVDLVNYRPQKVIAHFIQSKIDSKGADGPRLTDARIKKLIKRELNFDIGESTIRKYMKKAGIRKPGEEDSIDSYPNGLIA